MPAPAASPSLPAPSRIIVGVIEKQPGPFGAGTLPKVTRNYAVHMPLTNPRESVQQKTEGHSIGGYDLHDAKARWVDMNTVPAATKQALAGATADLQPRMRDANNPNPLADNLFFNLRDAWKAARAEGVGSGVIGVMAQYDGARDARYGIFTLGKGAATPQVQALYDATRGAMRTLDRLPAKSEAGGIA